MGKCARYIAEVSVKFNVDKSRKIRGKRKQRLKMWRSNEVQAIVANKVHRLAYGGCGEVLRGKDAGFDTYSICRFQNGKTYNCDLSASYNIGARYFIRELLKPLDENSSLDIEAKVPQWS